MKKFLILLLCLFATDSFATGISGNVSSAPCDNATLDKYTGTANVEINWEPNTINLNWYDGDTKLTVANVSQTCTYDGMITVPSQPTKLGYTFNGWKVIRVPGGFTELEYIEGGATLNAYIDLVFPATPTMQTLLRASIGEETNTTSGEQLLFGAADKTTFALGSKPYAIDRSPTWVYLVNGNSDGQSSGYGVQFSTSLNTIYQFKINYPTVGTIGVDDTTKVTFTNITSVSSQNLYVFGFNGGGSYRTSFSVAKMKLYNLKLWDNGELIHNYIPVKRNSDNTLGVYDMITGAFLTNAGTGSFVAGPAVQ